MEKTPICFITDQNYALSALTAIRSLLLNRDPGSEYKIYVLTAEDIPQKTERMFRMIDRDIEIISLEKEEKYQKITSENPHVSTTALYKFNLADIFSEYKRLLYIDTDVLILRDLGNLLKTDLQNAYAAVVETYSARTYRINPLDHIPVKHYFNSGVMLLNLDRMRREDLGRKLLDYRINGWNRFMDQDALNAVFRDEVISLPVFYNLMYTTVVRFSIKEVCEQYDLPVLKSWEELYERTYIVHFSSADKPWLYDNVWGSDLWYSYYKKLPLWLRIRNPLRRTAHVRPLLPKEQ